MKRLVIMAALSAVTLFGQPAAKDPAPPGGRTVKKLYTLKYADPRQVGTVLNLFAKTVLPNWETRSLAVEATEASMPAIEEAIARLDVPPAQQKNVELTVFYVVGANRDSVEGGPIPNDLAPVVAQLQKTFAFKSYRMLDSLVLRVRAGQGAEATGKLSGTPPGLTQFGIRTATIGPTGTIHIDRMNAAVRLPGPADAKGGVQYLQTGINTDVDVKEGQKVVVGKSSLEGPERALFLVLSARVIP